MKVPLVILSVHGSYLANPFWDEEHTRKTPMEAVLEGVFTAEEIEKLSEQEIQATIEEKLQYDEYRWQQEQGIRIREKNRTEGLHKALYQCRVCGTEFEMKSRGVQIFCEKCEACWELTVDGWLERVSRDGEAENIGLAQSNVQETSVVTQGLKRQMKSERATEPEQNAKMVGNDRIHIPDWYEWQRANVVREMEAGKCTYTFRVRVEALPNAKGFVELGDGTLEFDSEGFRLTVGEDEWFFDHASRESVQTEYHYRGRGMGIVLSTRDCCYYVYSEEKEFNPTWLQFAGEYWHKRCRRIQA